MDETQHVALPKLVGAPAYARPPSVAPVVARPFDPDELPIEAFQTDEDREIAAKRPAGGYGANGDAGRRDDRGRLNARPFSLRAIAGRLMGGS
jgi:hypothetical protein